MLTELDRFVLATRALLEKSRHQSKAVPGPQTQALLYQLSHCEQALDQALRSGNEQAIFNACDALIMTLRQQSPMANEGLSERHAA